MCDSLLLICNFHLDFAPPSLIILMFMHLGLHYFVEISKLFEVNVIEVHSSLLFLSNKYIHHLNVTLKEIRFLTPLINLGGIRM